MTSPTITLTTDFGTRDGYVAAMKGVILGICPSASIVDVSHDISPQQVAEGAWVLASSARYFRHGAIHVAVVDPGVGSSRRPILLDTPDGLFVSPDNGLLTHVLTGFGVDLATDDPVQAEEWDSLAPVETSLPDGCRAFVLDREEYWRPTISRTFHGRDIFAPVAAYLANGVPPTEVGTQTASIGCLPLPSATTGERPTGYVVHVDRFGNLITNIPGDAVPQGSKIQVSNHVIEGLVESYSESTGRLMAIVGSQDTVEIAVGQGNAATYLNVSVGTRITIAVARD